jgi:hypothetical protein
LERDQRAPEVELSAEQDGAPLGALAVAGAQGWSRFEFAGTRSTSSVELSLRQLVSGSKDVCFALEAH